MRPPIGVVVEFPEMDKLIDRAGVALEIADQLLVLPALLKRRETEFLVELHRLGHRADAERVGSQLVERHWKLLLTRPSDQEMSPTRRWVAKPVPYRHAPGPHPYRARRDDTGRKRQRLCSSRCNGRVRGLLLTAPWQSRTGRNPRQSASENQPECRYTSCRAG